jgi:hypothetical protein
MKSQLLKSTVFFLLAPTIGYAAGKPKSPAAANAPIPPAIAAARTVFLSNACEIACTNIYNELYAGLLSQGKYTLVLDPAQAELVFEIHFRSTLTGVGGSTASGPISSYGTPLNVVVMDRPTKIALWSISDTQGRSDQVLSELGDLLSGNSSSPTANKTRMQQEKH